MARPRSAAAGAGPPAVFVQRERQYGRLVQGFFDRHERCDGAVVISAARPRGSHWDGKSRPGACSAASYEETEPGSRARQSRRRCPRPASPGRCGRDGRCAAKASMLAGESPGSFEDAELASTPGMQPAGRATRDERLSPGRRGGRGVRGPSARFTSRSTVHAGSRSLAAAGPAGRRARLFQRSDARRHAAAVADAHAGLRGGRGYGIPRRHICAGQPVATAGAGGVGSTQHVHAHRRPVRIRHRHRASRKRPPGR